MKILLVQLARLGDIYQTWPVLKALKRTYPGVELHLLTRTKFADACPDSSLIDCHVALDTRDFLAPLIDEKPGIDQTLAKIEAFCEGLRTEHYDRVINLTFSPFSSYLVDEISDSHSVVSGYTRFADGFLQIPDDGSAYFYAQVGVGRANRLHVTDLFAHVAGVELKESDWQFAPISTQEMSERAILIHVGASRLDKTLSWSKWLQVVKQLADSTQSGWRGHVVLIGSPDEQELAEKIASSSISGRIVNLVGRTSLKEVFEMVGEAALLIGGDSAPVQMASLLGTKVLNISLPVVNFWETGPRAKGSRIFAIASEQLVSAEEIVLEAFAMLAETNSTRFPSLRVLGPTLPYLESRPQPRELEWTLLRALYLGEPFPEDMSELFLLGMKRLFDVNQLAIEQIQALKNNPRNQTASSILDRVDEIMTQIVQIVPEAGVLVEWFRTERLRIGPLAVDLLLNVTESVHRRFADVLELYVANSDDSKSGVRSDAPSSV